MKEPIFIFSGSPASGKTTIAHKLMQEYVFGYHIPVDALRSWVVSGNSDPIGSWDDETERQFRLAREGAAKLAKIYASAGFAVIIDDVILPEQAETHYQKDLKGYRVEKILLKPRIDVVLKRNKQRNDPNQVALEKVIDAIYGAYEDGRFDWGGWCEVDSSEMSVEETVAQILSHINGAR